MNASTIIDNPTLLLQSEPDGESNRTTVLVVCALAACAIWLVWRHRLIQAPREAAGRLPQDALLGLAAMAGFILAGSLGATVGHQFGLGGERVDKDYARLALGVVGNLTQVAFALAIVRSKLFVDASRQASRFGAAARDGALGLLLVLPIVTALGIACIEALRLLGLPLPPETSHETLRILQEKGDAVFSILTLAHVALLVPLAEEAGWRGILQPSIRRAGLGPILASLTTAVLFAAIHWSIIPPEGRAAGLVILVTLGFALGLLRERTGGILAPTILHAAFNAWNVAITLARDA